MSVLNERIKERRLSLGLTLLQVAEKIGVKEATMQRYESGEIKNIKHDTIVRLSCALKCSPEYLIGWSDALLRPAAISDGGRKEIDEIFNGLSEENRSKLLELARLYLASQHNTEEKG